MEENRIFYIVTWTENFDHESAEGEVNPFWDWAGDTVYTKQGVARLAVRYAKLLEKGKVWPGTFEAKECSYPLI